MWEAAAAVVALACWREAVVASWFRAYGVVPAEAGQNVVCLFGGCWLDFGVSPGTWSLNHYFKIKQCPGEMHVMLQMWQTSRWRDLRTLGMKQKLRIKFFRQASLSEQLISTITDYSLTFRYFLSTSTKWPRTYSNFFKLCVYLWTSRSLIAVRGRALWWGPPHPLPLLFALSFFFLGPNSLCRTLP